LPISANSLPNEQLEMRMNATRSLKIGVAGTGRMGAAMARRLIELGHRVAVWNRSAEKAQPLLEAGAQWAATPKALAEGSEFVLSIVTDARALDAVYRGAHGLLAGGSATSLFIEMSTVAPEVQQQLATDAKARGLALIDCPVGGTVGPAREGKLLGVAGGSEDDVERARQVLNFLCRRVERVGPAGAGAAMKLAINLPLIVYWQAMGEALALAKTVDASTRLITEILADSSGAPTALRNRIEPVAQALGGAAAPGTYDIDAMRKDLRTMLEAGESLRARLPLVQQALACLDEGSRAGLGGSDGVAQSVFWRSQSGTV
jgi:3-hydroxyisobutyrate dehydrogenase